MTKERQAAPANSEGTDGLVVDIHLLHDALKQARAKLPNKKPCVVALSYDCRRKLLEIKEVRYETFTRLVPANGTLPTGVQVQGLLLFKAITTYLKAERVELSAREGFLDVRAGRSRFSLNRLDGTPSAVKPAPMPADRRHKGKVDFLIEGRNLRTRGDQWAFSANVPFKPNSWMATGTPRNSRGLDLEEAPCGPCQDQIS